jgi:type VI secretion system protein ImpK
MPPPLPSSRSPALSAGRPADADPDIEIVPSRSGSSRGDGAARPEATPRLANAFEPLLLLCLRLGNDEPFGEPGPLRRRLHGLLDRARREARAADADDAAVRAAAYAAVALVDETVQRSDWGQKDEWLARPLQRELFGRFDAGEEFFATLDRLRAALSDNAGVLEVYYLCLTVGFEGRYRMEGDEARQRLIDAVFDDLDAAGRVPRMLPAGHAPDRGSAEPVRSSARSFWIGAAAAVFLAALLYAGMSLRVSSAADRARAAIEAATPAAPEAPASALPSSSRP